MKTLHFNQANWTGENGAIKIYKNKVVIVELDLTLHYTVTEDKEVPSITYRFTNEEENIDVSVIGIDGYFHTEHRGSDSPFIAIGQHMHLVY